MAAKAKRFYKSVDIAQQAEGYVVRLDGRVLKTPGKVTLIVPNAELAEMVAAEWDAQHEYIDPASMPCTRLLNVAIERVPENREDLIAEVKKFTETDALCYRDGNLAALARKQAADWGPMLDWARGRGITLQSTDGLIAIQQDNAALNAVEGYARPLDDIRLTLFAHFTNVFGSAVLGMAVMEKHVSAEEAFDLSRLAEDWQIAQWGEDDEAKAISDALRDEVKSLGKMIA